MDNFNSTFASLENKLNVTYIGNDTMDISTLSLEYILRWINMVTACIELPFICFAAFALYHQVKADHVTPVFVINLLISDVIQIIGRLVNITGNGIYVFIHFPGLVFLFGLGASIKFMLCIALERYLMVVHPLWYRCRRTIKHSVLICLAVFVFEVLTFAAVYLGFTFLFITVTYVTCASLLILPLPLLLFFLIATQRVLSHCISVPHKEKKRILGILVLVLLIYLAMIFPSILLLLAAVLWRLSDYILVNIEFVVYVFLYIIPLMDPLLYIFIKKDDRYTLKVPRCCRIISTYRENGQSPTVPNENVASV